MISKIKYWLCCIGFHSWKSSGFIVNIFCPNALEQCKNCGIGRQFNLPGYWTYFSKERMEQGMRRNN